MLKALYRTNNQKKNNDLINMTRSGLSDSEKVIQEISANDTAIEKPYKLVYIVKKILEFNRQNKKKKGLKILTPDKMLSRLSITLAEIRAANNSENLKNEATQLSYFLYRSKKLTKTIYNNLINTV